MCKKFRSLQRALTVGSTNLRFPCWIHELWRKLLTKEYRSITSNLSKFIYFWGQYQILCRARRWWWVGSKFFQFHAVFGKILQNLILAPPPPGGLALPPWGNPGSATTFHKARLVHCKVCIKNFLLRIYWIRWKFFSEMVIHWNQW